MGEQHDRACNGHESTSGDIGANHLHRRPKSAAATLSIPPRSSRFAVSHSGTRYLVQALRVRVQASGSRHDSRLLLLMITEVLSPGIAGRV